MRSKKPQILIASSSLERKGYALVYAHLRARGVSVIVLETDNATFGTVATSITAKGGEVHCQYGNAHFSNDALDAAWYHKPDAIVYARDNVGERAALERESRRSFVGIWGSITSDKWLNAPRRMNAAQDKVEQAATAQRLGLLVPQTLITNSWDEIADLGDTIIAKMPFRGEIMTASHAQKLFYTTIMREADIAQHRKQQDLPFPGIYQPYIPKKKEWRITVVGEKTFAAAIYTDEGASDDWRKHSGSSSVRYKKEAFPDSHVLDKCTTMLKHYGLRYGAFDFIETPSGEIYFLEVNPAGQYYWLEELLGLPISEAIATELLTIAYHQSSKTNKRSH